MKYIRQQWRDDTVHRRHDYKRRLRTTELSVIGVPRGRRPSAAASHRLPQSTRPSTSAQGSGDSHTDAIRRLSCRSTPICRNVASVAAIHMPRPGRPHGDATAVTPSPLPTTARRVVIHTSRPLRLDSARSSQSTRQRLAAARPPTLLAQTPVRLALARWPQSLRATSVRTVTPRPYARRHGCAQPASQPRNHGGVLFHFSFSMPVCRPRSRRSPYATPRASTAARRDCSLPRCGA